MQLIFLTLLKTDKPGRSRNFIYDTLKRIWILYGIFATIIAGAFAFIAPHYIGYTISVLMGFSAALTGIILKNHWITAGGIVTGLVISIAITQGESYDMTLAFSLIAIINLIIPGIMMNRRAEKH